MYFSMLLRVSFETGARFAEEAIDDVCDMVEFERGDLRGRTLTRSEENSTP